MPLQITQHDILQFPLTARLVKERGMSICHLKLEYAGKSHANSSNRALIGFSCLNISAASKCWSASGVLKPARSMITWEERNHLELLNPEIIGAPEFPEIFPILHSLFSECIIVGIKTVADDILFLQTTARIYGLLLPTPFYLDMQFVWQGLRREVVDNFSTRIAAYYGITEVSQCATGNVLEEMIWHHGADVVESNIMMLLSDREIPSTQFFAKKRIFDHIDKHGQIDPAHFSVIANSAGCSVKVIKKLIKALIASREINETVLISHKDVSKNKAKGKIGLSARKQIIEHIKEHGGIDSSCFQSIASIVGCSVGTVYIQAKALRAMGIAKMSVSVKKPIFGNMAREHILNHIQEYGQCDRAAYLAIANKIGCSLATVTNQLKKLVKSRQVDESILVGYPSARGKKAVITKRGSICTYFKDGVVNMAPRTAMQARTLIGHRVTYLLNEDINTPQMGVLSPRYGEVQRVGLLEIAHHCGSGLHEFFALRLNGFAACRQRASKTNCSQAQNHFLKHHYSLCVFGAKYSMYIFYHLYPRFRFTMVGS